HHRQKRLRQVRGFELICNHEHDVAPQASGSRPRSEPSSTSMISAAFTEWTAGCANFRLRRRQLWSAGTSEARPRFGSLVAELRQIQSAVAAALCRRTPKVRRVVYPADSSLTVV